MEDPHAAAVPGSILRTIHVYISPRHNYNTLATHAIIMYIRTYII